MPKSKRARLIHTSVVQKTPSKARSASLYAAVQAAADSYQHVFVFAVDNMRNTYLKAVRQHFATDGRLFFGKTKVMAKALGATVESEHAPGLAGLAAWLAGSVGLLCTDRGAEEVVEFFAGYCEVDFARAGGRATRGRGGEVAVEEDVALPHSLEVTVRKWGMPTRLEKGKVVLGEEYVVAVEGQELSSQQTALLKLFGVAMAEFKVQILAYWSASTQEVVEVGKEAAAEVMKEG
ncbi:mRNA turnover and ribosome assembly protein [Friedmanniomyces endolithicus]|uniref:Ribosome assembly factor mrt4 n=1 Tax=Friedmanniomyces endolithicus TaxID=329885 RepID=A0AAN6FX27_9PEZI|nr:mRNA turnover and ribosome assembly protein [Friedmanniomyces endolithicus]KAK0283078.1 mRNA turnover and ribosome assembly protein [Friedmanniomyces endolithicus]KAK0326028.1 mRNA turnover and ribosome assembly protein [Friedmanniomyces endolithicus]KAK0903352.1 mRNA turnover and ribosome assembly protein [Friedmanniomyces endolithicus]KAK0967280.1 mRNA turnover and ribosome assembly protein [Friedmanniomyces endolithicus]